MEDGVTLLDRIHFRDVGGQVNGGLLPVRRGGVDNMQRLAEAELKAYRHHHARREESGKEITLLEASHVAIHFLAQAGRIMALREADRAGGLADQVILLNQPPVVEVPPLGARSEEHT